ncbi:MAG TPA: tRNA (adenosine(37)-N6)-threonylcarbamoyltransferase complex transferase subunit TsaD [Opitutae bacterium]|nr:tRNA (adenosine(37)-N6)-threonylcarbamoyltransferase complex transferase subunit TsaD [Opitutae bacterium]
MILAIESSCDESAIALFEKDQGILGEWVHRQVELHLHYGGVVPDLASREHMAFLPELLKLAREKVDIGAITQVAVTLGPGLAGCLAMGVSFAKALAWAWKVPLIGVNHLRGHAFSPFIALHQADPAAFTERLQACLPHLGLLVSGGNTLLFELDTSLSIRILAETVDDAAGEALDKGAKLLGMPYPGGPLIEAKALEGDTKAYGFPRAFPRASDAKFSFSGLKTSLRYFLEKVSDEELASIESDVCASYQEAVMGALVHKTKQVLKHKTYKSLGLSGGVANNQRLRALFKSLASHAGVELFVAEPRHTGDNAAMIAFAAYADRGGVLYDEGYALGFDPSMRLA